MVGSYSRVLVAGGAGFIGSHLVDRLLNEGLAVTVIDNLHTGHPGNIAHHEGREGFHFVEGDIRDLDLVKKTAKDVDAVFHEAALVSVDLSVKDPILTTEVNIIGTLNLLKASLDLNAKRFIYASSGAVYGVASSPKVHEDMIPQPTSPYGVSKLAAETYVKLFNDLYGIQTVSLRYFNVYGPRQHFDLQKSYGGVITVFINRLLKDMPPVIFGDGKQTRDFVYIRDVVEANMLALYSKSAEGEVFNIGTGKAVSINQVAEILKDITGRNDVESLYTDPRPGDVRHGYADIDKARRILGFAPKTSVREGLTELVRSYIRNSEVSWRN